ncbi:MAG: hypothetical protein ACLQSR_15355 [Limisphaerales bacterium]
MNLQAGQKYSPRDIKLPLAGKGAKINSGACPSTPLRSFCAADLFAAKCSQNSQNHNDQSPARRDHFVNSQHGHEQQVHNVPFFSYGKSDAVNGVKQQFYLT